MNALGWLTQQQADLPAGDAWLGAHERAVLAGLSVAPRRLSWRLGRWTAKAALAAYLEVAPTRFEVLAADDGAPEVWLDGTPAPMSLSLSHRAGRALAVVTEAGVAGCDIELVEPRSDAFIREWLAPSERYRVFSCQETRRALLANLIWTAKEAAAKVRREGLRLDLRRAMVQFFEDDNEATHWQPLRVWWDDGTKATDGWWRHQCGWVMAVATEPGMNPPRPLALRAEASSTS